LFVFFYGLFVRIFGNPSLPIKVPGLPFYYYDGPLVIFLFLNYIGFFIIGSVYIHIGENLKILTILKVLFNVTLLGVIVSYKDLFKYANSFNNGFSKSSFNNLFKLKHKQRALSSLLFYLSRDGCINPVKPLLEKYYNDIHIDYIPNDEGQTPLMVASENGYTEIVQLLLEKGADVNAETNDGKTALMYAAAKGRTEIVQLLLEKGADVNTKIYGTPILLWAHENGHTKIIQLLLEKGADVNAKNKYGETALMRAAKEKHIEIVQLLLENGM